MYLHNFSYVFQHKASQNNKVVDTLSMHNALLSVMKSEVSGFDSLQDDYVNDPDFGLIWEKCISHDVVPHFHIHQGFLVSRITIVYTSSLAERLISF